MAAVVLRGCRAGGVDDLLILGIEKYRPIIVSRYVGVGCGLGYVEGIKCKRNAFQAQGMVVHRWRCIACCLVLYRKLLL